MQRSCDSCGKPYEAKRKASRYCSDTCRKRAQRAPNTHPVAVTPALTSQPNLVVVAQRELEDANRLNTVLGQQALALAQRICSSQETGAAVASLSKEFRAVMDVAMDGVGVAADPLDELRTRRDRKRGLAG